MKMSKIKEIRNSLFTRLTLTSMVTGISIVLSVFVVSSLYFRADRHAALVKHVAGYTSYIIDDIGLLPDTEKAAKIASEGNIFIEIKGAGLFWRSSGIDFSPQKIRHKSVLNGAIYGSWDRRFVFIAERNGYTYSFVFQPVIFSSPGESFLPFLFLLLLISIIIVSYLIIRRMLLPLKGLGEGVAQNISGNLSYRIPEMKDDEIGRLALSFNKMTDRIESMIESREQLLRDVSHELRSPLTRMKVALEIYGDENIKKDIGEDICILENMIKEILESERMNHLTNGDMEKINLNKLIREVVSELNSNGTIAFENPEQSIIINSKEHLLKIVLRNIVQNAVKYTDSENAKVRITCFEEIGLVKIIIEDNGSGLPESERERIFDPFYRIDKSRPSSGGYGLGLHIAKKSIEALGGKIDFENSSMGGAAVIVMIYSD